MKLQNVSAQSFGNLNSDKKAKGSGIKGGSLALLGAVGANTAISSLSLGSMNIIKKQAKNFTKDEIESMNRAADEILNNVTNLSKKGVKIFDYSDSHNLPLAVTDLAEKIPERFHDCIAVLATKNGKNAYYSSKVPKKLNPPDSPLSTLFKVKIFIGFFLDRIPISDAKLSDNDSPIVQIKQRRNK